MRKNNIEFQHKKNVVLFIYGYKCQLCSAKRRDHHIHHINKNGNDHHALNLVPLCVNCHFFVHSVTHTIYFEKTTAQLTALNELQFLY